MTDLPVYLDAAMERLELVTGYLMRLYEVRPPVSLKFRVMDTNGDSDEVVIIGDVMRRFPTDLARAARLVRVAQEMVLAVQRVQFGYAGDV